MSGDSSPSQQVASPPSTVAPAPDALASYAEDQLAVRPSREPWFIAALSPLGGAWIALGFVFYVTSQTGASAMPYGMAKVVGGVVFSVGLLLVVITGAELFTSTTMTVVAKAAGRVSWTRFFEHWAIVWLGNFVGALVVVALSFFGDLQHNASGAWGKVVVDAAATKLHHTWFNAFVLGIFANLAVCLGVWLAWAGKTVVDKALAVVGPVALFVSTGMEHSVANMFLLPYAVILRDFSALGLDMAKYADLTWPNVFLHNLLPVTLGNIIGGGFMCGLYQWWIWHRGAKS
ncbi:formate transporter FocA [Mariniluteicoccus endophyticus]